MKTFPEHVRAARLAYDHPCSDDRSVLKHLLEALEFCAGTGPMNEPQRPTTSLAAAGPWVLASERLPEQGVVVLTQSETGDFRTAYRHGGEWRFEDFKMGLVFDVLRWAEVKP